MRGAPVFTDIFVMGSLALLGGCTGSLLETKLPVPTIYVLSAAPAASDTANAVTADVAISMPTASPGLDTDRIAVLREARRLDYYRESQWGAALPQVVQSLMVGSLQNQKWFGSVTTEQARVNAAYLLDLDIRDFQAEYSESSAPRVKVTLVGSLIRIKDRKLIRVLPASFTVEAKANRMTEVIEAFESAARQAALSLAKQVATAMSENTAN